MSEEPFIPRQFDIDGCTYLVWTQPTGGRFLSTWACRECQRGFGNKLHASPDEADASAQAKIEKHHAAKHDPNRAPTPRWLRSAARIWAVLSHPIKVPGSERDWVGAVFWFGIAISGIVTLLVLDSGVSMLLVLFPTTPVGIGGGIGSLYGRGRQGALLGLLVLPALTVLAGVIFMVYVLLYWILNPGQAHF